MGHLEYTILLMGIKFAEIFAYVYQTYTRIFIAALFIIITIGNNINIHRTENKYTLVYIYTIKE